LTSPNRTYAGESLAGIHIYIYIVSHAILFVCIFRYIGLRLCDMFYEKFNRYPGEIPLINNEIIENDRRQLEIDFNETNRKRILRFIVDAF
jgi:hypothetical protein